MIFTLIYVSDSNISAFGDGAKTELMQIEQKSRFYNSLCEVRGLLFYFKNRFVQILQGDFDAVISTFGRIKEDPRHSNVRVIWFSDTEGYSFGESAMFNSIEYLSDNYKKLTIQSGHITSYVPEVGHLSPDEYDLFMGVASDAVLQMYGSNAN